MTYKGLQRMIKSYCRWCLCGNKKDLCVVVSCPFYKTEEKDIETLLEAVYEKCKDCWDDSYKCGIKECKLHKANRYITRLYTNYTNKELSHRTFFSPVFKRAFIKALKIKGKKMPFSQFGGFHPEIGQTYRGEGVQ